MTIALVVVVLLAVALLPSALNIPQSNPNTVPEYAPVPPDEDSQTQEQGNLAALGQAGGSSLSRGGGLAAEILPAASQRRSGKRCVGNPPRQSEDPMAPPCVAFFEGDNGGATYQGVTGDEIVVLVTENPGIFFNGESQEESPPPRSYCDLDKPPNTGGPSCNIRGQQREYMRVRMARAYMNYFNERFQTYGRRVHYWMYFTSTSSTGSTVESRRADAADNVEKLRPFAVINQSLGNQVAYAEALARRGVMTFPQTSGMDAQPASLYQKYAPLIWSFGPDTEHWADGFAGYACKKIAGFPVSHAPNGIGKDGMPMQGRDRRYGFVRNEDPNFPQLKNFATLAGDRLRSCGVVPEREVAVPTAGIITVSSNNYAATNIAALRDADVTTVVWFGGWENQMGQAADAVKYYPEIVIAGDGFLDGLFFSKLQNQNWWRQAWGHSTSIREGNPRETHGFQACREGNPDASPADCEINNTFYYRTHFLAFKAIQAAGPRLTPRSVDRGMHAIPRISSTNPFQASCFFDPGDYSCVKDGAELWWDPEAVPPGKNSPGCYRMVQEGRRYLADEWPAKDEVFRAQAAPCTTLGAVVSP